MSDLDVAIHNREMEWPPGCSKSPDGRHRIAKLSGRPSAVFDGWTLQDNCGLCGEPVDTGEAFEKRD